jgi:hypothetical protein
VSDAPLPEGTSIVLFADADDVTEQDVLDLWARDGTLAGEEAHRRLEQVFMVAVAAEAGLIGVMTAFLAPVDQLRLDLWVLRALVDAEHRRSNVVRRLFYGSVAELEARYVDGRDRRGAGTFSVFENAGLQARYTTAVTPSGNTYIGDSPRGEPMFVRYFQGATIPDGDPRP